MPFRCIDMGSSTVCRRRGHSTTCELGAASALSRRVSPYHNRYRWGLKAHGWVGICHLTLDGELLPAECEPEPFGYDLGRFWGSSARRF